MVNVAASTVGAVTVALPDDGGQLALSWAAQTNTGLKRSGNQDSYLAAAPVFAVADGMGGHAAGDEASAAVVMRLAEYMSGDFASTDDIARALRQASDDIGEIAGSHDRAGSGTTVTGIALTIQGRRPYWAVFNIGDSRVYSLVDGVLTQVTVDHSAVQAMVDSGRITALEAESHPNRNIITRAVGFGKNPVPDLWFIPVSEGARLLICSDGLTKEVDVDLIRLLLAEATDADDAAGLLLEAALAAGGRDNVTTLVVEVLRSDDVADADTTLPRYD
ncbi:PP2C family protein-serine/threonine phosphatase [Agreia sp. Leaf210]|uniref:PP2C family protein-serine/threonine phosphatase n=1 Tax=Agreia sp. Leaf210 TaxID=1735682 RepID=UPI000B218C62|nr:protein phosphatase 2C domain-containing protein [Agreia sp. Leaf210]